MTIPEDRLVERQVMLVAEVDDLPARCLVCTEEWPWRGIRCTICEMVEPEAITLDCLWLMLHKLTIIIPDNDKGGDGMVTLRLYFAGIAVLFSALLLLGM